MNKERSESSLEITKPQSERAFPEQKSTPSYEINQLNIKRKDLQIKGSDLKQEIPAILFNKFQTPLEKLNLLHDSHLNRLSEGEYAFNSTTNVNLFTQGNIQQNDCQEEVNFQQFFGLKNKYSSLNEINNSIIQVIQSGKITISPKKHKFAYKKDRHLTEPSFDQRLIQEEEKMKAIAWKKQKILDELNKLYAEEREVRNNKKALALAVKANHESTKLFRNSSEIDQSPIQRLRTVQNEQASPQCPSIIHTRLSIGKLGQNQSKYTCIFSPQEERKSISKILKEGTQRQIFFNLKQKKLLQKAEKQNQRLIQEQRAKIQEERQKRRSKIIQRIKKSKVQKESSDRTHRPSFKAHLNAQPAQGFSSNEFFFKIQSSSETKDQALPKSLPKKYIYKQFEIQSAQKLKERKKNEQQILKKRRQQTKVDFEEIRIHLQKYKQIKMEKIELQREKMETIRGQQKQRLKQIRQKYGFLTKIKQNMLQQQKKSIQMMESTLQTKVNYRKKMKEYFISVKQKTQQKQKKQKTSSRIKTSMSNENNFTNNQNSFQASRNMTVFKNSRLDNTKTRNQTQFMSRKKASSFENSKTEDQTQKRFKYKDYLLQMRKNANSDSSFQTKQRIMMQILKNENSSMDQIQKAFEIFKDLNTAFWKGDSLKGSKMIKRQ